MLQCRILWITYVYSDIFRIQCHRLCCAFLKMMLDKQFYWEFRPSSIFWSYFRNEWERNHAQKHLFWISRIHRKSTSMEIEKVKGTSRAFFCKTVNLVRVRGCLFVWIILDGKINYDLSADYLFLVENPDKTMFHDSFRLKNDLSLRVAHRNIVKHKYFISAEIGASHVSESLARFSGSFETRISSCWFS